MSFEEWQIENQQAKATGFDAWQAENEMAGIDLPTGGGLQEFGKGLVDVFLQGGKGALGTVESISKIPDRPPIGGGMYFMPAPKTKMLETPVTESLKKMQTKIEAAREPFEMTHQGVSAQAGRILGNAVGYMGMALAGGYVAGPVGAAMVGFSVEGQDAYDNAIKSGATEEQAQTERLIVGSINAAIEALQIGRLMKFHKTGKHSVRAFVQAARAKAYKKMGQIGAGFGSDILRTSIEEGLEEFAQEGVSMAVPAAMREDYPMKSDGSPDLWAMGEQLGTAAVGGAFAGGVLGVGGAVVAADVMAPGRKRIERTAQKIRESDMSDRAKARMIGELEKLLPEEGQSWERIKNKLKGDNPLIDYEEGQQYEIGEDVWLENEYNPIVNQVHANEGEQAAEIVGDLLKLGFNTLDTHYKNGVVSVHVPESWENRPNFKHDYSVLESSPNVTIDKIQDWGYQINVQAQLEIPGSTRRVLATADKLATPLKEMQAKRSELEEHVKTGRAKVFGKQAKVLAEMQADDPLIAKKLAQRVAKEELRKDYPDVAEQFSQEDWRVLVQSINEATDINQGEKDALYECLDDLFIKQKPPGEARLKLFDRFFGTDIVTSAKNLQTSKLHQIADVMNVPKAILASFDVSMPLRQAWHYTMAHPIKSIPSWGKMLKAFCSDKYSKFVEMELRTNENYQKFVDAGLEQTKTGSRTEGEEYFQGELAHRIPGIGRIVKASERSAVTYMNHIRMQAANHFYDLMGSPDINSKAFQDMIDFVNHSTSRGGFKGRAGKWFKKWSPELGAVLWTPKMIVGKVQSIADLRKPEIRKLVACETLRAFGGATLAAMLLALGFGGKFGKDPRSSDFGKVVIGKTRLDLYGTYLPMFRLISQLVAGERKAATTGRLSDVERKEVITRFLRSKLNPMAGVGWDIWTGETFLGKKMKWEGDFLAEYIAEHITPLFLQDLKDAVQYQGLDATVLVAPLAVHGAGAATYEPTPRSDEVELKNHYAHQTYGTGWDQLGPSAQKVLRTFRPDLVKAEEKTRAAREDYTFIGKLAQEEQDVGKRIFKKLPKNIQKEMNRLTVDIGGLRRQLKSDWYLNKKRYNQYQRDVQKMLEKSLPNLINNPSWNVLNDDVQQVILQTQIDTAKKLVRQRIVMQANMKDLERRK